MTASFLLFHTDQFLAALSSELGVWLYVLIFLILFAETGLVVTPFLPGDSLLFALGAMTSIKDSNLSYELLSIIMLLGVFLGDNTNYHIGRYIGPRLFKGNSVLLNKEYLIRAESFYTRYGTVAVIIARFIPIVRTFVPFVAGLGKMNYRKYLLFSVFGAIFWIQIFLFAGRTFGNLPSVKANFHIVIFAVIGLSILPLLTGYLRRRKSL